MIPLDLTRPLAVFDLETTSLDVQDSRIIEIGLMVVYPEKSCSKCLGAGGHNHKLIPGTNISEGDACLHCSATGREPTLEWRTLANPGIPIPAASTEIHGITDAMVQGCQTCGQPKEKHLDSDGTIILGQFEGPCLVFKPWPTFRQLAQRLAKFLYSVDFAGKNTRFDLRVLQAEMDRARQPWSYEGAAIVDADMLERLMEPRDLSSLYKRRCGKEPVDAHSALADVRMSAEVIAAQLALWSELPRDLKALHELQWKDWIDDDGMFKFDKGGRAVVWFGKHRGKLVSEVPGDYWDYVLKQGFGASVKRVASEAKLGRYPERKS